MFMYNAIVKFNSGEKKTDEKKSYASPLYPYPADPFDTENPKLGTNSRSISEV